MADISDDGRIYKVERFIFEEMTWHVQSYVMEDRTPVYGGLVEKKDVKLTTFLYANIVILK